MQSGDWRYHSAAQAQVSWTFTPPKTAHFGGIYEIMVKASKRCLKAI
jgi:hypothetical protein